MAHINDSRLAALESPPVVFHAVDRVLQDDWKEIQHIRTYPRLSCGQLIRLHLSDKEVLIDEVVTRENVRRFCEYELEVLRSRRPQREKPTFKEIILQEDVFWNQCQAISSVTLKLGAQVMLLKNLDLENETMLVNGSRGVIVGFNDDVESILMECIRYNS